MQLTDAEIKEFQQIYYQTFGKRISRKEAIRSGMKLIRLLRILCEPEPINEPIGVSINGNQPAANQL